MTMAKAIPERRQVRAVPTSFETRDDNEQPKISGYFVVFGDTYEIAPGLTESIAPGAFEGQLSGDVRALVNHDATLVLGRTKSHTLELREDSRGLWGEITINREDRAAMDLYERVKRGDVDQCSFGFDVLEQTAENRADGSVHWVIQRVKLYEVSACTFPAYEQTNISARSAEADALKRRALDVWKTKWKGVLKKWH